MMKGLVTRCLRLLLLLLTLLLLASFADAFVGSRRCPCTYDVSKKSCRRTIVAARYPKRHPAVVITDASPTSTTTAIGMSSSIATVAKTTFTTIFTQLRQHTKILLLLLTASLLFAKRSNPQTLLWPGTQTDKDCDAPLPNGGYGCPFIGINFMGGSKDYGPLYKLFQLGQKYGKIYRLYGFGMPLVSVSGMENVKSLLKNEFKGEGEGLGTYLMGKEHNSGDLFGDKALLYENVPSKHGRLRKLAGEAMSPVAIGAALPSIQELASQQIEHHVVMYITCTY